MAVTTTDVVTSATASFDNIKNGSAVVYCWRGAPVAGSGSYQALVSPFEYNKTYSYTANETRLTNRFDDITYYFDKNA
jgi:hypothetical protein